jgi:hypothetical protein
MSESEEEPERPNGLLLKSVTCYKSCLQHRPIDARNDRAFAHNGMVLCGKFQNLV